MPSVFFIGLGYSARPLAEDLARQGWDVVGTTRDRAKAMTLPASGVRPLVWESPAPLPEETIDGADAVIVSTGPNDEGCPAANALPETSFLAGTQILYLSSSGVYGDHGGDWIDETAECHPGTERGVQRLAAERQWQEVAALRGASLTLCRLAGIYGPGRNAVESLRGDTKGARAGLTRRLEKPGQVFNRIHRDDIARGLEALLHAESPPGIVNFADDEPSASKEPIEFASELLGIEPPPLQNFEEVKDELSPMARSFYAENKRLRNDRLKALTGALLYPTYREGLRAIYER